MMKDTKGKRKRRDIRQEVIMSPARSTLNTEEEEVEEEEEDYNPGLVCHLCVVRLVQRFSDS